jgi:hypothetical protein
MTVVRAQDGSSAASFQVGALVEMRVNAATVTDLVDEHDQAVEISIADAGNYYTSTNVEGALQEAAQASTTKYTQGGTGASTRTVQARLRDFVSVKDFGAVGNGVADDTAAIQAALNKQGSVYVPEGLYKITSDLTIKSNTLVQFASNSAFIAGANNITFFKSTASVPAYFTQIHNAQLSGNGFTGVVGFDMYNFRLNAGLFNPNMAALEVGIIYRYGCFDTVILNPTAFNKVPFPVRILDNSGGVQIINPAFDNTGNTPGTSIAIDIQLGATAGPNIGCSVQGGYCQGFNVGISDAGYGTQISKTYFEQCVTADVLANDAEGSIYTGTQHWAISGAVAIKGTGSDGITIISPLMGASNRSVGLLDFDGSNTNCLYINSASTSFKNAPLGVTTGVSFSIAQSNISAGVVTARSGCLSTSGSVSTVTATPAALFTIGGANRGRYDVVALIANSGSAANYTASASVIWDGTQGRIVADNGSLMTLTISGAEVRVTQSSGSNQTVRWSHTYQPI